MVRHRQAGSSGRSSCAGGLFLRPVRVDLAFMSSLEGPPSAQTLPRRRAIIDRARVQDKLARSFLRTSNGQRARAEILDILKEAQAQGRAEIESRFEAGASGRTTARALAFLADQLLRLIYDHVTKDLFPLHNPSMAERLALVAVGGFGRGELAPFSDLDILFLHPYKIAARSEQVVEATLYLLWDLGFKVGHATRSLDESLRLAGTDTTVATSLLESRYLWGDQPLYLELRRRYGNEVREGRSAAFIEAKLRERDRRHQLHGGGSRYVLEPNIKESKGGLRDLHTLFWLAKFVYGIEEVSRLVERGIFSRAEVRRFTKALDFFWTLRCQLHYLTARAEERLTFDLQQQIAPLMGYTDHGGASAVERLMKHYFLMAKEVGALTRIFCAQLEAEHARGARFRVLSGSPARQVEGFGVEGGRLFVESAEVFAESPRELLRIFRVAQQHDLDIHPQTLRWITRSLHLIDQDLRKDPRANAIFMDILTAGDDPEIALRRMNEAGVLGRFVPEFGRVVSQMQFNMYHHYTVDEHTIFALGILYDIEQGRLSEEVPIARSVVAQLLDREGG